MSDIEMATVLETLHRRIRELEAELAEWKSMWGPHCDTDRGIEADCRSAVARAEKAEARVKELEALAGAILDPDAEMRDIIQEADRLLREDRK